MDEPRQAQPPAAISADELRFIERAADYLRRPSFLLKAAALVGKPLDALLEALPQRARRAAAGVVERALQQALEGALLTLPAGSAARALDELPADGGWNRLKHNLAAGVTGALGGAFGLKALAIELPISTTIILRDIASVAISLGEDPQDPLFKLHCLGVFSFAAQEREQAGMESTYYATRLALAKLMQEAAPYVVRVSADQLLRDLALGTSPALVRLVGHIAQRFNIVVSQKLVAQAVPGIGALGGALVNVAFTAHFDRVARYHFGIRALERKYGNERIQAAYLAALERLQTETARLPQPPATGAQDA